MTHPDSNSLTKPSVCVRAFPCRYQDARQCAHDTMLGSECPKVCGCECHINPSSKEVGSTPGPAWRSDKAREVIRNAADRIANCYCSEDDAFEIERERLTVAISQVVDQRISADSAGAIVDRPKVICLCGSTRFIEQFAITTWELEREGFIVLGCTLLPMWYCKVPSHFGEATGTKEQCDQLHLRKIDLADEILVLNIGGYIGESTANEITYATRNGKPVRYLEP